MNHLSTDTRQAAGSELQCCYEGTVATAEIDHLGHMNVRAYAAKALRATRALVASHGLSPDQCAQLCVVDAFTRHYREQVVGARLAVRSGVLAVRDSGLRLYHELFNVERHELAATFVYEVQLQEGRTRAPRPIPESVRARAADAIVVWPAHGQPRSIDLSRVPFGLTLESAVERRLAIRHARTIGVQECDAWGFYDPSYLDELVLGGQPTNGLVVGVPSFFDLGDGRRFAWATLESRNVLLALPRAGSRIQSFVTQVELARKTWCGHYWAFDLDRRSLVFTRTLVLLAFDPDARHSIEIPPRIRSRLEAA